MNTASEQWWEKKLNIRTCGKIDHFIEEACNPYEPTDTDAGWGVRLSFSARGQDAGRQELSSTGICMRER